MELSLYDDKEMVDLAKNWIFDSDKPQSIHTVLKNTLTPHSLPINLNHVFLPYDQEALQDWEGEPQVQEQVQDEQEDD